MNRLPPPSRRRATPARRKPRTASAFVLLLAAAAAALLMCLAGCGGDHSSNPVTNPTPPPVGETIPQATGWTVDNPAVVQATKKWTVLVYMNAANNLEEFSTINANMMETVGSNSDVNIVLQFKRIKGQYSTTDGNWGGTRRYYLTKDSDTGHVSSAILSEHATLDMGSANSLHDFIQWGTKTYPANHYCLFVWNHGAGWRAERLTRAVGGTIGGATRGVSYDDQTGSHIETTALPAAIDLGSGRKWDLLAWDSSLMQMAEVDYEIRDKVQYIVGSEESPPGLGYPYHLILADLENNPNWDGASLGTDIAQKDFAFYTTATLPWHSDDWQQGTYNTQSVIDASKLAGVASAVNTLGSALMGAKAVYGTAISNDRASVDNYDYPENRDLLDFTRLLATTESSTNQKVSSNGSVASAITQVNSAVKAAVLYNQHGSGHSGSNGLAILLTSPSDYLSIDQDQAAGLGPGNGTLRYSSLAFSSAAPNWQNFLANGPP